MQEIKEILLKHDIAGVIVLHTPGHSEYLSHLTPSYSCAKLEGRENELIRFRAKAQDFGMNYELRNQKIKDTCNMMRHLSERTGLLSLGLIDASELIDKHAGAEHGPGYGSSQTAQDN